MSATWQANRQDALFQGDMTYPPFQGSSTDAPNAKNIHLTREFNPTGAEVDNERRRDVERGRDIGPVA